MSSSGRRRPAAAAIRKGKCALCRGLVEDVHHIVPRAAEGGNHKENLVGLCEACHQDVHRGLAVQRAALVVGPIVSRAVIQARKDASKESGQQPTPLPPIKTADDRPGANAGYSGRRSWRPRPRTQKASSLNGSKPPSQRRGGRPKGSGEGLLVAVATKLRPEELTALDLAMPKLGAKSRSELVRKCIRLALGV